MITAPAVPAMAANLTISEGDGVGVQITTLTTVARATMSMNSQ